MIEQKELVAAGKLIKPHGIKGELTVHPDNPFVDMLDIPYIVCCMDGIYVPFFIESVRSKGNTSFILKLDNIDSERKAKDMSGLDFYCSKELIRKTQDKNEPAIFSWHELIGYQVEEVIQGINLGEVTNVDDSTQNILFCITNTSGKEILIPANQDFIVDIHEDEKILRLDLPSGLIEL